MCDDVVVEVRGLIVQKKIVTFLSKHLRLRTLWDALGMHLPEQVPVSICRVVESSPVDFPSVVLGVLLHDDERRPSWAWPRPSRRNPS